MNLTAFIAGLVDASARRRNLVLALWAAVAIVSLALLPRLRLDALPDLAEPQVVVATEWPGKSARAVEEQVTYPVVSRLQGLPGVRTVRGQSMTGMSFVYAIFRDGVDRGAARGRVLEQLSALHATLPPGVTAGLGPDASGVGWIFQYALRPRSAAPDHPPATLDDLRAYQDTVLRHALGAVPGVAEIATVGGHQRQFEIAPDPERLRARQVTLGELARALRTASSDIEAGPLELGGRDLQVTLRAPGASVAALEAISVRTGDNPVRVRDVATVSLTGAPRRGVADLDGAGDVVGGIVIMRDGQNAPAVLQGVKQALRDATATLPAGAEIVTTYDRSGLIDRAVATLGRALLEETAAVVLLILAFLLHLRSAALPALSLPLAVLVTLGVLSATGVPATIMSLGGIAIALGATVDAEIVMLEACHRRLEPRRGEDRPRDAAQVRAALTEAGRSVTPAIVCSLLIIAVAFLPVFVLDGQAGRLFAPLAQAKTTVMIVSALMSVTLAPALRDLAMRGRIRPETRNPLTRLLVAAYRPFVFVALRNPRWTLAMGALALLSAVPVAATLGEEFMPDLDEGDLLYMPTTTLPVGPDEAQQQLQALDRALRAVPEVATVFGKAGRASTATDPAPLTMIETTVQLKPRALWRHRSQPRWYSGWAPAPLRALLRHLWTEDQPLTRTDVVAALDAAAAGPSWTGAWTMPIRTRIDMQSTGVRTAAGLKIYGRDLQAIDRTGQALAQRLRTLPGTRSAVYEPIVNGRALDIVPDLDALARNGVELADVQSAVAAAGGGLMVGQLTQDRTRPTVVLRLPAAQRASLTVLGALLIPAARRATAAVPPRDPRPAPATGDAADTVHEGNGAPPSSPLRAGVAAPTARTAFVHLREVAALREIAAPAMVRDEDGRLCGYVYVDVDSAARDLAGYVEDGVAALARWQTTGALTLPSDTTVRWTGSYEALAATRARLIIVIPLVLLAIALLLYALFRSVVETLIVLLSIPFALIGSLWALAVLDYHLSAPVWIGLIAVVGLAAQTGVVMIIYMDQAFERRRAAGLIRDAGDVVAAVLEGTVQRVRPKLMTVAAMIFGLLPLLWATSSGADVIKRIAAPMVGGLVSSAFLTLELIPVVYTFWRQRQLRARP
ncbi:MAG: copper/silver efflux system protein [Myxococcales bacterium]|nr:copper/silver efflux system protein [Myxococcales bacterium]